MRKTCKRRPRQGGFFLLPNEIFPLGLSAGEIAVYAYLIFCEDRETHLCYPSFRKIGEHTGMSPNTVRKYVTQLEDKRLIETLPTTVWTLEETARNGTLLYTILPIHEAVNYHLEGQLVGLPMRKGEKRTVNPNPALCGPVCDFDGRDREMTPAGRVTSPVGVVWGSCGQQLPKASLEKPTDTKYPSFPTEKHRASLW